MLNSTAIRQARTDISRASGSPDDLDTTFQQEFHAWFHVCIRPKMEVHQGFDRVPATNPHMGDDLHADLARAISRHTGDTPFVTLT